MCGVYNLSWIGGHKFSDQRSIYHKEEKCADLNVVGVCPALVQ